MSNSTNVATLKRTWIYYGQEDLVKSVLDMFKWNMKRNANGQATDYGHAEVNGVFTIWSNVLQASWLSPFLFEMNAWLNV